MFVTTFPDGHLSIIRVGLDASGKKLAKTMFELSRSSDMATHFDPEIHTLQAVAKGITGHVPLSCRECDEADLPVENSRRGIDPTFRDSWEDTGTVIRARPTL